MPAPQTLFIRSGGILPQGVGPKQASLHPGREDMRNHPDILGARLHLRRKGYKGDLGVRWLISGQELVIGWKERAGFLTSVEQPPPPGG